MNAFAKPIPNSELAFNQPRSDGENGKKAFLSAEEAAPMLNISPRTLLRWAREGLVPAHPLSGTKRRIWRFVPAELDAWAFSKVNSTRDCCQNSRRE